MSRTEPESTSAPETPPRARTHGPRKFSTSTTHSAPSETVPFRPLPDPSPPSPGPEFRPLNPPYSGPGIPPIPAPKSESDNVLDPHLRCRRSTLSEFRRVQRVVARRRLVGGSGPIVDGVKRGGRPAVVGSRNSLHTSSRNYQHTNEPPAGGVP